MLGVYGRINLPEPPKKLSPLPRFIQVEPPQGDARVFVQKIDIQLRMESVGQNIFVVCTFGFRSITVVGTKTNSTGSVTPAFVCNAEGSGLHVCGPLLLKQCDTVNHQLLG
jgi:hypothetical protein